jgi:hypothetical protein
MTISSDEFDADFRQPLYDMISKLYDDIPVDSEVEAFRTGLVNLTTLADDYRVELLDQEDKAEEEFNARHAADDLGDAKLEERRDEAAARKGACAGRSTTTTKITWEE